MYENYKLSNLNLRSTVDIRILLIYKSYFWNRSKNQSFIKKTKAIMGLGRRCKFFERKTWNKICSGKYPLDIHLRFYNPLIMVGDKYVIFQGDADQFLVSMGDSPILGHEKVELTNKGQFAVPGSNTIVEQISAITCLPYKFRFTKEIVEECTGKYGITARQTILSYPQYDEMVDRLLHQKNLTRFYDTTSCAHFLGDSISWPMIAIGILLLLLMFTYRS